MKRRIFAISAATLATACIAPDRPATPVPTEVSGWVTPPTIDTVVREPFGLTVRGRAAPAARVVLRGAGDIAYAAGADAAGRFEIRIRPPTADSLFVVETQVGEAAAPAPYRLLVSRDLEGPIALVGPGAPTRRLDPGPGLDVIDGDGRTRVASGRAAPGTAVAVAVGTGEAFTPRVGPDGRWSLVVPSADVRTITVAGRDFSPPGGTGGAVDEPSLTPTPGGWRFVWRLSPTSRQTSWFPDRPAG